MMLSLGLREEKELEQEIETYARIAMANGSFLTVEQLAQLVRVDASGSEIAETLRAYPLLRSSLLLRAGYVIPDPKNLGSEEIETGIHEEEENRKRAVSNIRTARSFSRTLSGTAMMVAVGGTNSYMSAREKDDIDLFCIAKKDTMWILMLEALIRARVFELTRRQAPPLCFSFMMDEAWVEAEFGKPRDAIFARDLLTSKVVRGREVYGESLRHASWMASLFPRLYANRLAAPRRDEAKARKPRRGLGMLRKIANLYLYTTLGSYIVLKAWLLNRRFAREGHIEHVFTTDVGPDHCVYESNRYRMIRRMYSGLRSS